ncbi:DNA mismatch endonuclease Vsr [Thiocapsa sp.]|uniref:DNA mismatch endonuclease Vsr n=1 Tax=Thiocapsa sp. TaxID=2024551 RepID=UPI0035933555
MTAGRLTPWMPSTVLSKPESAEPGRGAAPSFAGRKPASAIASRTKQRNRKVGTKAEIALRRALWGRGLRYRVHQKDLPGCPDLVFRRRRVVVFVDGDFWHGRDWEVRKERLRSGHNAPYWLAKISYNRERDLRNNTLLSELGWRVVRLWETEVLKDPDGAARLVANVLGAKPAC